MIVEIVSLDDERADHIAAMVAASIADQNASIELIPFTHDYDLDDSSHHGDFRAHVSHYIAWHLAPALAQPDTAIIVTGFVSKLLSENNGVKAHNLIRSSMHPMFQPDITLVVDVSPESVHAQFCETCKETYTLAMLQRERDILLTLAENSPKYFVFDGLDDSDDFDLAETLAEHIWDITGTMK